MISKPLFFQDSHYQGTEEMRGAGVQHHYKNRIVTEQAALPSEEERFFRV